jgi:hypothetical protein
VQQGTYEDFFLTLRLGEIVMKDDGRTQDWRRAALSSSQNQTTTGEI